MTIPFATIKDQLDEALEVVREAERNIESLENALVRHEKDKAEQMGRYLEGDAYELEKTSERITKNLRTIADAANEQAEGMD